MEAAKSNTERIACFVAGTLVHTREGLRPIEQIKAGDHVLSKPENGQGETAYKRVVRTVEVEDQETWFVSWEDRSLTKKLVNRGFTNEEFLGAYGNSFVITTPNHPFWVLDSDEEILRWHESKIDIDSRFPRQQWVRADRLIAGMIILLANGSMVDVSSSCRVYKTDNQTTGWVDIIEDQAKGLIVSFEDHQVQPNVPIHAWRFHNKVGGAGVYYGKVENPNDSYADDDPAGNAPESWYRTTVYSLEVEEFHTYFVDTIGVWVHNTNCGDCQRLGAMQEIYTDTKDFNDYVRDLPDTVRGYLLCQTGCRLNRGERK